MQTSIEQRELTRVEREQHAYDEASLWERSHRHHQRFQHVFDCPNTMRYERIFEQALRDAAGKRVLEIGCGDGSTAAKAAGFGASYVLGMDVSRQFVAKAREREIGGKLEFLLADVSQPLDSSFDVIFGRSILHHLDYRPVLLRLFQNNLTPGGVMFFMEPFGSNPLIKLYHRFANAHTPDERSFERDDLKWFRANFKSFTVHAVNLFSFPVGILSSLFLSSPDNAMTRLADRVDVYLAEHCKSLTPDYRHSLLFIRKPEGRVE
jgi:2-polyprenyl-3-methyl-5-hydroxy-6-metoxy-1,4-benzoquinol methylase